MHCGRSDAPTDGTPIVPTYALFVAQRSDFAPELGQLRLLQPIRRSLAAGINTRVAGANFHRDRAQIWDAPGERWFGEQDPIWRVHGDASMFIGGLRALLLQSLHPTAMQAVSEHSGFRSDPWGRLQRTSRFIAMTTYGPIPAAERSIARIRRIHDRVRGFTDQGIPYQASDPVLLAWIHLAEVDSFLRTYQAYGRAPLSPVEADQYIAQSALVAQKLGVVDPPQTVVDVAAAIESYRPLLRGTPAAAEATELLIRQPPLPASARLGYAALVVGAVATLPAWARAELRLPTLPTTDLLFSRPAGRAAVAAIRWALAE